MTIEERKKELTRLKKIGKKGGKSTVKKHGRNHMSKIGKIGGANRLKVSNPKAI